MHLPPSVRESVRGDSGRGEPCRPRLCAGGRPGCPALTAGGCRTAPPGPLQLLLPLQYIFADAYAQYLWITFDFCHTIQGFSIPFRAADLLLHSKASDLLLGFDRSHPNKQVRGFSELEGRGDGALPGPLLPGLWTAYPLSDFPWPFPPSPSSLASSCGALLAGTRLSRAYLVPPGRPSSLVRRPLGLEPVSLRAGDPGVSPAGPPAASPCAFPPLPYTQPLPAMYLDLPQTFLLYSGVRVPLHIA